ncbi:glycosyltransferase [Mesorhizobium sp. AR10]|uniref:glycosyltransferase n=1 Tax=Mesorhizobium sp. AR10 TaxID=2865839 RepID=UPI00215EC42C|nr:glycosyltransferase [Mesorhizobium sp. AR10]UVK41543.1 glycosyltransferase [Mesorhizobium sp. AR10]
MTSLRRVTIITPFLNAEATLGEAIASVWDQTVTDWELLLVDDGSTDDSVKIANDVAATDPRIKVLRRPPGSKRGAAAARNAGIEASSGDLLAFLDADDLYEPHMLETVLAAADANPEAAMIFGPTRWWYPDGESPDWIEPTDGLAGRLHQPPRLLSRLLLMQDGHVPCTCSVLVRRSAIELVVGFEERFRLYEDQALWVKLFLRYPAYVTPICLSRYRQHSGSVSADAAKRGLYDRMASHAARAPFLDWLTEYVVKSGIKDPKLDRAIRLARSPYTSEPTVRNKADRLSLKAAMQLARLRHRFARKLARLYRLMTGSVNRS